MNQKTKNIALVAVIILIVGVILYLESQKPASSNIQKGTSLALSGDSATGSSQPEQEADLRKAEKAKKFAPAKEIVPGGEFVNTKPFALKDLIGKKVILLDFWTYSCINCQRTIPYLNAWYAKYKDQGFTIVGVHSPEFDFEKDPHNVEKAVKDLGILYPVVQDNDMATWQTYENQYWPHEYLIDIDGYIVHDKIGEGGYDETEQAIQAALKERSSVLGIQDTVPMGMANPQNAISFQSSEVQSPETYFGAARNEYLGNGNQGVAGVQKLSIPSAMKGNTLYLGGTWDFQDQYAQNQTAGAKIVFKYSAKNVYFVTSSDQGVTITVKEDGNVVTKDKGKDISADGTVTIQGNRLYHLIESADYGEHTLEIIIDSPGLKAYTFTFG